jgi:hypothetical protein
MPHDGSKPARRMKGMCHVKKQPNKLYMNVAPLAQHKAWPTGAIPHMLDSAGGTRTAAACCAACRWDRS